MRPARHALALSVAGLCSTAYALPQIPYYASKYPQHPQNLGYAGNYPKYWQGESYATGNKREPEPETAPPRPDFAGTKHPAKEAIKHYGAQNFSTKSATEPTDDPPKAEPENASSSNIKITNDTPSGAANNDRSYTRITKSSSLGGPDPAPAIAEKEVVAGGDDDGAGSASSGEDVSDDLWNSFSFGVISDTLNYHDPYEGRAGGYKRKTNAISKVEKMMGKEYSAKEISDASGTSKPSNSRIRRRGFSHEQPTARHEPTAHQEFTPVEVKEEDKKPEKAAPLEGKPPDDFEYPKYYEPEYDTDHIRIFGYDIRGYDLPTLKLIDAHERKAREAGVFRPYMYNPHIPDLTMDADGNWKTPAARQPHLTKRDWPEHIRAKAEKMMHSAKEMQEKGQLVIDNDPAYQKSLQEKKEAREKELAAPQATDKPEAAEEEENLSNLPPPTRKNRGVPGPKRKAHPGGTTDDMANPPPQSIQPGLGAAKTPKLLVHKQPNQKNDTDTTTRKVAGGALRNKQQPRGGWQSQGRRRPVDKFLRQGRFKGFKKNPIGKRDITYPAGPEYPPGTIITRKKKCDDTGKCVTVSQPVATAALAVQPKFVVEQLSDGQPQIRPHAAPHPIAPAPAPEATIQKAPTPHAHPPAVIEAPAQTRLVVAYVPVVKPGKVLYPEEEKTKGAEVVTEETKAAPKLEKIQMEKEVQVERHAPVFKEVVRKPCGCECSSCSCEDDAAPADMCPCGDPKCGKGDMGPEGCTCGAPGCNCNKDSGGSRSFSSSYSNGVKDVSRTNRPGRNTTGAGNGRRASGRKRTQGHGAPSTPAELEAFWRKRVPEAFKHD